MSLPENRNSPLLVKVAGVAILLASIALVLFSGASSITTANIQQRLQQFGERVAQDAADAGKEGRFSYDRLDIEGWGYNKHGVIGNVSLELSEKSLLDTSRWTFSTTRMLVLPDPLTAANLFFVFPEPINVIENSQLRATINFSAPPKFTYYDAQEKSHRVVSQSLHLPGKISLLPAKAVDEAGERGRAISVTFDPNPIMRARSVVDTGERNGQYEFQNLRISDEEGGNVQAATVSSHFAMQPGQGGRPHGKYSLSVTDFVIQGVSGHGSAPYSLTLDSEFDGDPAHLSPPAQGDANTAAQALDVKISKLQLAGNDFKIMAEGTLSSAPDDPLPYGALSITIYNVPQLLASELVPESARSAVVAGLQKVSGVPEAQMTQLTIPLKREKSGVMHIGNTTFEELAASMLAGMLRATPQAPAVLPPDMPADLPPPAPRGDADVPESPAPELLDEAATPHDDKKGF